MIEWYVDFQGQRKPLRDVQSPEARRIVEPTIHTVTKALEQAAVPEELQGLKAVIYAEEHQWGVKLEGPASAVNYALALLGDDVSIIPMIH